MMVVRTCWRDEWHEVKMEIESLSRERRHSGEALGSRLALNPTISELESFQ